MKDKNMKLLLKFQSSFELTGYITSSIVAKSVYSFAGFKVLSSLRVI